MRYYQVTICAFLILILPSISIAGSPVLRLGECTDSHDQLVRFEYREGLPQFAVTRRAESQPGPEESPFVIYINPELFYLGNLTQIWLYQRQCAHIKENHALIHTSSSRIDMEEEERADCIAVRLMLEQRPNLGERDIYSIERDMNRVNRENKWREVLPGRERNISLRSCLE